MAKPTKKQASNAGKKLATPSTKKQTKSNAGKTLRKTQR